MDTVIKQDYIDLLHLSDTHLVSNSDLLLSGVDTFASFVKILDKIAEQIRSNIFNPACIVHSGDVIDDHELSNPKIAYQKIFSAFEQIKQKHDLDFNNYPWIYTRGNHDVVCEFHKLDNPPHRYAKETFSQVVSLNPYWNLINLHSSFKNTIELSQVAGYITDQDLVCLKNSLDESQDKFTIINLHHNLLDTQNTWLDKYAFDNQKETLKLIASYPNVKFIMHGHIHHHLVLDYKGVKIISSLAVCFQFRADKEPFPSYQEKAGYIVYRLYNVGNYSYEVKRI